jgi:F-type H+-transporting ATPase subunit gamma
MSGLKQLRSRIKSIKTTKKITKAMQLVSSSKFRKIKPKLTDSAPYINTLRHIIEDIASSDNLHSLSQEELKFFSDDVISKPDLLVVVTSERGLCGGFNASIIRKVKADIADLEASGSTVKLMIIGKKGYDALKGKYSEYINGYYRILGENFENFVNRIKQKIVDMVENDEIDSCYLYFNKFKNAMMQSVVREKLLPIAFPAKTPKNPITYEYEGNSLVFKLINLYIKGEINFILLNSRASEEGARMTAMDNATKNAKEIIKKLTLQLNRSRQATITRELTEIIAGSESM